jgi:hypothetical protein
VTASDQPSLSSVSAISASQSPCERTSYGDSDSGRQMQPKRLPSGSTSARLRKLSHLFKGYQARNDHSGLRLASSTEVGLAFRSSGFRTVACAKLPISGYRLPPLFRHIIAVADDRADIEPSRARCGQSVIAPSPSFSCRGRVAVSRVAALQPVRSAQCSAKAVASPSPSSTSSRTTPCWRSASARARVSRSWWTRPRRDTSPASTRRPS